MEEPRDHCTVVFALIDTDPASECVCVEGGDATRSPFPLASSVTIYAKTIVHLSPGSSTVLSILILRNNLCKEDSAFVSPGSSMVLSILILQGLHIFVCLYLSRSRVSVAG